MRITGLCCRTSCLEVGESDVVYRGQTSSCRPLAVMDDSAQRFKVFRQEHDRNRVADYTSSTLLRCDVRKLALPPRVTVEGFSSRSGLPWMTTAGKQCSYVDF